MILTWPTPLYNRPGCRLENITSYLSVHHQGYHVLLNIFIVRKQIADKGSSPTTTGREYPRREVLPGEMSGA